MSADLKLSTFSAHCSFLDNLNTKSKTKHDNLIPTSIAYCIQNPQILYWIVTQHHKSHPLSVVPLSLIHLQPMQPPSKATTTTDHPTIHNHRKPQATSHNTTKIRSTTISKPKSYQTHSLNKQTNKKTPQSDWPPQLWVLLVFHLINLHNAGLAGSSLWCSIGLLNVTHKEEMRKRNHRFQFKREKERDDGSLREREMMGWEFERPWEFETLRERMKHMKIDTSFIYLVSLQNLPFDLVSLYIFVIFMFLEERDIKYK